MSTFFGATKTPQVDLQTHVSVDDVLLMYRRIQEEAISPLSKVCTFKRGQPSENQENLEKNLQLISQGAQEISALVTAQATQTKTPVIEEEAPVPPILKI